MKKVSVIVPCHNATKWLPQCFLSLVNQTIGIDSLELIFVDDASTDEGQTWGMLEEFERAFPESIMVIHLEENMRQGGARNVAMQYAGGEYLAFVDADDFVEENYLECVYQKAKETNAEIIQFEYVLYTERLGKVSTGRIATPETIEIVNDEQRKEFLLSEKITYGCWNKLYQRELVLEAGARYAEHVIYEEPLFVYPLLFSAKRITIMGEAFYCYRQNDVGTMRRDMKQQDTLMMHANVQLQVWNFMKNTVYFAKFYEEIKLYFLHTYFFETLLFAKQREFEISMEMYLQLEETVKSEVCDFDTSTYEHVIPKQMELYKLAKKGMTKEILEHYMEQL